MADKDRISLNPQWRGMTQQQIADKMASGEDRSHPSATAQPQPSKFVGPSIQPNAPGGKSYGAPIQAPILK